MIMCSYLKVDKNKIPNKKFKLNIAVCVQVKVKAMSTEKIDFSLVWNMPKISFIGEKKVYKKYDKNFV